MQERIVQLQKLVRNDAIYKNSKAKDAKGVEFGQRMIRFGEIYINFKAKDAKESHVEFSQRVICTNVKTKSAKGNRAIIELGEE